MAARGDAAAQLPSDIGGFGARKTGSRAIDYQPDGDRSFPLRLQPDLDKPAEGNFSSDCGVVLASYPRVNGVQVCFSPVNPGGHLSSLVSFLSFCIRGVTRRFELAHFNFTFSPSSTRRRMACPRVIVPFDAIHLSIAAISGGCQRSPI